MSNTPPDPLAIDWCARAAKLQAVELAILTGEMVTEARFGADMTKFATASLSDVRSALSEALNNCAAQRGGGGTAARPKRYAMAARARPY